MLGIGSLILAKQSMMVLITMVVVAGVGLRASLRSLGRSSQRLGGPHLPPEATTLSHTYHHTAQSRDKAGQTSSAE